MELRLHAFFICIAVFSRCFDAVVLCDVRKKKKRIKYDPFLPERLIIRCQL